MLKIYSFLLSFSFIVSAANPVIPSGRYKGQEIDISSKRSVQLVSQGAGKIVVDQFLYDGKFWRAKIPLEGIEEVIGQSYNFSENGNRFVNHVQTRFHLKKNSFVDLYPMEGKDEKPSHQIGGFVYSVEVVGPKGTQWNMADAVLGNFVNAHRLIAMQDMVAEKIGKYHYTIYQSIVGPLEPAQKRKLLIAAIENGHRAGFTQPYYLIGLSDKTRNCTSEAFRVLDQVVPTEGVGRQLWRLPLDPRLYLRLRGLYGGDIETVNEEWEKF